MVVLGRCGRVRQQDARALEALGHDTRLLVGYAGVDVLGVLSEEQLTVELLQAKALAAPSFGAETFGMVLTRALACATPVVASDIDG